jgi:predicted Fe-Mo cluster-binding NifX family protein
MKILLTAHQADLQGDLEQHFGRAPFFIVYDLCDNTWTAHPNDAAEAAEGAGIRAAANALRLGVQTVVTGSCGPKAMDALRRSEIRVLDRQAGPLLSVLDQVRGQVLNGPQ